MKCEDPPKGGSNPFIFFIADDSAASKVKELAVGNRIVSVNGETMTGKTGADVHAAVKVAEPGAKIEFEIKIVTGHGK